MTVKEYRSMEEKKFLIVDYEDIERGLDPLNVLIVSKVKEYERNGDKFTLSNNDLCKLFNVNSSRTIMKHIDELVENGYISRKYTTVNGKKARCLSTNDTIAKNAIVKNAIAKNTHQEDSKEKEPSPLEGMTMDEKVRYLERLINNQKFANDSDEDFF